MFLRELVHHGVESGALRYDGDIWRWPGPLALGERLQHLIAMRMGALDDAERAALEAVALGQPLSADCVDRLGIGDLAARLERRGLVTSERRSRVVFTLAHPLFGEVLCDGMPPSRRDELQLELADALEATSEGSASENLRIALWRVDAGDTGRPDLITDAATHALRMWEPAVAERLARAALTSGPAMQTAYVLGAALSDQNRAAEALEAFRLARSLPGPERLRAAVAADEAGVLSHQLGRLEDAERILAETLDQLTDPGARAVVAGGRAAIVVSAGQSTPGVADELAARVPTAALAAAIDHAAAGRLELAASIADEQLATAARWTDDFPTIELYLTLARAWIFVMGGELECARLRADEEYARALEEGAEFPRLTWSVVRGLVAVAQGRPRTATRALHEAVGGFERADRGFLRPSHGYLAMAAALVGDLAGAAQHRHAAHAAKSSFEAVFAVDLERAHAWSLAAEGRISDAAAESRRIAAQAEARGASALEVLALHDASRFGGASDVVGRLEALVPVVDGPFVAGAAAYARALVDDDGGALDAVSESFASLALDLFAAEASAGAARAHRNAGRRASAFASATRAQEFRARCESAHTPTLDWAGQPRELTTREREVADLAAAQLTSREIAERLGITTRTVDNLLGRVYTKLGVSGRQALAEILGTARTE
jgi:DNA-binding CsgD family transcriptional regulator